MKISRLIAALCSAAFCAAANASFVYTFEYSGMPTPYTGLPSNSPAPRYYDTGSISFTIDHLAQNGDVLTWLSGSINGCAPGSMHMGNFGLSNRSEFDAFPEESDHCTNPGIGNVGGLIFYADTLVTGVGTYASSINGGGAGRLLNDVAFYTTGSLTVSGQADVAQVPEPATLALSLLALLAAAGCTGTTPRAGPRSSKRN